MKKNKKDFETSTEIAVKKKGFYYGGDDLGVLYTPSRTTFRFWSPLARWAKVYIFSNENSENPEIVSDFKKEAGGSWVAEVSGDLEGKYYIYELEVNGKVNRVVDPYARALSTNSKRGLIVNMDKTNPPGWEKDERVTLQKPQDAIIYEVHVRDFSSSPHSGIVNKGKYLAFTEGGTTGPGGVKTGLDHLKELGVTHVHLLPVFDFGSVDDLNDKEYNWGYDPLFYNTPEGSYSTNPSDDSRIKEFKQLVKSLHENGIGVIMDVVYNHTYYTRKSAFDLIVPQYYYRFDHDGNYSNGSGCGNEVASEKPMVRKFIIDSVKYWAEEYHIDGFRFDLMALIDRETIKHIEHTLHEIDPSIIIYGEPWTGGLTTLDPERQLLKGAQKGMKVAVFNDNFRNAIKGDNDGFGKGFASGAPGLEHAIKRGVVGAIYYNDEINDFSSEPRETVNYVSSHDNLTLWDKLCKSNGEDEEWVRIRMDHLSQAIIFTSQGVAFIQGGEEFLRTKFGNHNSYNAGDEVNQLKWERKSKYLKTFKYYKGLITLRREHPAFRMTNAEQIRKKLEFLETLPNTVGFILKDYANGDNWKNIVVLYNPNREAITFNLPYEGAWNVVVYEEEAGTDTIFTVKNGEVKVPLISTVVLYQD
ncbi:type I pullulanase [Halothermothrix orenii]|uniref:Pullulanase, type I n=1 Tax=Halothermothrix orenii (strain H 168 / OCM 544 / DSM 9562) TaxID=373903 RepID=B8CXW9_HALOH|nr:type I pullulanase [Halothermothrix orenii]ACL70138.1 pullulanase, type I [Halothermothrix orenii H 168]